MTAWWLVISILGVLTIGFAYAADQWHQRAVFWERRYWEKAGSLEALLDGVEEYVDSSVVRVYPQGRREVMH
jgi:hypothetical protein